MCISNWAFSNLADFKRGRTALAKLGMFTAVSRSAAISARSVLFGRSSEETEPQAPS